MDMLIRKLGGIIGIGVTWGVAWAAFFGILASIIGIVRPQDIDAGETPALILGTGLLVGFVSGALFGVILSFAEHRKTILDLALLRVTLWGLLAGTAWPQLTPVDDRMIFLLAPLGAFCAAAAVEVARRANRPGQEQAGLLRMFGKLLANPLQSVCAG